MSPTLHIALQDGFADDTVVVRIDGEEVFRRPGVSTDYRISLAGSFEKDVDEGRRTIEVELPEKGLSDTLELEHSGPTWIAVSILEDGGWFRVSDQPFGYV